MKDPKFKFSKWLLAELITAWDAKIYKWLMALGPVRTKMSSASIIWVQGADPTVLDFPAI